MVTSKGVVIVVSLYETTIEIVINNTVAFILVIQSRVEIVEKENNSTWTVGEREINLSDGVLNDINDVINLSIDDHVEVKLFIIERVDRTFVEEHSKEDNYIYEIFAMTISVVLAEELMVENSFISIQVRNIVVHW